MTRDATEFAKRIRGHTLRMVGAANASHIGSCLSSADILAILYAEVLRVDPARTDWPERDRFILSKGHAAAILYATLAERGFIPIEQLATYSADGSPLMGHVSHKVPGVEVSTGSLGHGLPIGCGLALGGKRKQENWRTFVLLSDGELDEGSNWEAALFAGHHGLDQLVAIVDYNKIQSFGRVKDILDLEPLADKWRAFRWEVCELDGHDIPALRKAMKQVPFQPGRPSVVIAHTVKGKGVSFMENDLLWHYRPPDQKQLAAALTELGCGP